MIAILNSILSAFASVVSALLSLLPNSPFSSVDFSQYSFIRGLNFFIPIVPILSVLGLWLSAVSVWYVYRWVFRFVRAVG